MQCCVPRFTLFEGCVDEQRLGESVSFHWSLYVNRRLQNINALPPGKDFFIILRYFYIARVI